MEKSIICQSCSMPLVDDEERGTNGDGSTNVDYCIYCFKDGNFINDVSLKEYIEMNVSFYEQAGMTEEEMRKHCETLFPTLKRWVCTCDDECTTGYSPNCNCSSSECHCREEK